jgi:hypothetical protein
MFYPIARITDYTPSCSVESDLKKKLGVKNDYEYRIALQKNAEQIMKQSSVDSYHSNTLHPKVPCEKCGKM